jgi:hypothetical protein
MYICYIQTLVERAPKVLPYLLGPLSLLQSRTQMVCPPFTTLLSSAIDEEIAYKTPVAGSMLFNELLKAFVFFGSPYSCGKVSKNTEVARI